MTTFMRHLNIDECRVHLKNYQYPSYLEGYKQQITQSDPLKFYAFFLVLL